MLNSEIILIFNPNPNARLVNWWAKLTVLYFVFLSFFLVTPYQFVLFFKNIYIYMSWQIYCYTNTIKITIFSKLLRCRFLINWNKIIKYETMTNHNWKYFFFLQKFCNTYCYHYIFTIVEVSISYRSNKKNAKSTTFSH